MSSKKPKNDPAKPPRGRTKKLKTLEARAPTPPVSADLPAKAKKRAAGEVSLLAAGQVPNPGALETIGDMRAEMGRIYRLVFKGKIELTQATRLAYFIDRMIVAKKTEHDLDQAQQAYAKAWGGVIIIGKSEEIIDHAPQPPETQISVFSPDDGNGS